MEIIKYPDNSSYINVTGEDKISTFRINSYEDLWHLHQFVEAMNSTGYVPTIIIPNLIDGQADRRFAKGQSIGLKLVCNFLNNMKANFKIFHPHNPEAVEALMDNVEILDNTVFIKDVLSKIYCGINNTEQDPGINYHTNHDLSNLILMSSDAGGFKPLSKLCDKLKWGGEMYSAAKARSWDEIEGTKFVQQVNRTDFEGKDILIVDDISVYGGTFKGLSKLLKSRNCGKLYLAVSHMTVQCFGSDPVTNYFEQVFTTNSKFDNYGVEGDHIARGMYEFIQPENLKIIKMF